MEEEVNRFTEQFAAADSLFTAQFPCLDETVGEITQKSNLMDINEFTLHLHEILQNIQDFIIGILQ